MICESCGIRAGLGDCSICMIRAQRGVDGLELWIRLALRELDCAVRDSVLCDRLVKWARGLEVDLPAS